jgi:hypothetical protein
MRFLAAKAILSRKVSLGLPLVFGLALSVGLPSSGLAQIVNGSIVGTVTDPTGAVIQNSTVTAVDTATGLKRVVQTNSSGIYSMTSMAVGTYSITANASGFRPIEKSNVTVTPGATVRVNVQLQVGASTQEVSVSAMAVQLQTDKADTHTEITGHSVETLPVGGNRQYQTLINLAPGTTQSNFLNSNTDVPAESQTTHVNGAAGQTNVTRIDGAESVNMWLPRYPGFQVPAQDVEAVTVTTSASDAAQSYGGASSISVVTKSGTNQLHGSALWFHNNQHLNARNFFLKGDKPVTIFNDVGGTLGGPIKKNKLFYFFAFDGTLQKTGANGTYTVPTADQRAGDFSAYDTTIYNPFSVPNALTGTADGKGRTFFPNNKIPTSLLSPQALAIQSYLPLPNQPGTTNNYSASGSPAINLYRYDAKVNWNPTSNASLFFKYDNMKANSGGVGIFGDGGGPTPGSNPGEGITSVNVAGIGGTYILSPTMLLSGNVAYQRMNQYVLNTSFGTNFSSILGIPGLNGDDIRDSGFPNIDIGGYTSMGTPNWMSLFRTDENYTGNISVAVTKGKHQLRFGFDMVRFHLNHWQPELSAGGPRGYFDFDGSITTAQLANGDATDSNQFNSYAQFLLGLSDNTQKGEQYILMTTREWQFGWFAQDTWQISQKLTLDVGLRYDLFPLMTRCCGTGIERYDPSTNLVHMGGRGDVPLDAGISVSHKLFAPRAGLAYRLDNKTVIRAGYGINFDPLSFGRPLRGFYPLTINDNYTSLNSFGIANLGSSATNFIPATLANGIPPIVGPDLSTGLGPLDPNASERSPLQFIHRGYIQSYNFTIERELPEKILFSAAYVGTHTVHAFGDFDINSGFPGSGSSDLPQYASLGRTTATNMWDGYLSAEYNSLQAAFNRQFANGLMLKGSYTWAHAINYADNDGWTGVNWNWNPVFQRNRASAGYDQRHTFQLGWVYSLPFGPGKKYLNSGIGSKVLEGWQFSGVEAMHTGNPLFLTAPGSSLNAPNNTQTPNQVMAKVPFLGGVGPGAHWYDPAAFAPVTAANTFGSVGRNILAGPGLWNTDLSIARTFPISERVKFEFRTEFYNLPNTSHFNNPGSLSVTSGSFMQVTSSYGERQIRFAGQFSW